MLHRIALKVPLSLIAFYSVQAGSSPAAGMRSRHRSESELHSLLSNRFRRHRKRTSLLWLGLVFSATAALAQGISSTIVLDVDATTISRKILSAHESFPVASSSAHTIDLVYPKWIPGDHAPTGPIADLVNLRFTIRVPAGTNLLVAEFSLVGEYVAGNDFAPGNTSTPVQGDVNWDQVVLYPADTVADQVRIAASIKLPERWSYATALPNPSLQGSVIHFDPVSLTTLVDSPLMCGSIMREFDITPKGVSQRHLLDLFEKSP